MSRSRWSGSLVARWRWVAFAAVLAVLLSVPTLVRSWPVGQVDLTAEQLRDLVRASDEVAWEGFGESRVDLPLPDVRDLDDVPSLLGGRTRARATWVAPDRWRVDDLRLAGEVDTITTGDRTTTWTSADRTVDVVEGSLPVHLPTAADLMAPMIGRRLAAVPDATVTRLDERRVAGRTAAGLRLTPRDPATTTVSSVDLWVDPDSGLALRVEVKSAGQPNPVLVSLLLDLSVGSPDPGRLAFTTPAGADEVTAQAPDVAAEIDRRVPYELPATLAGRTRQDPTGLDSGGVGVYGEGFGAHAVAPLPDDLARQLRRAAPADGLFANPLVNVLVGNVRGTTYVLVGTVPPAVLQQALAALQADPPRRLRR
jgi:hypothetical protein